MGDFKRWALTVVLILFFATCSNEPSESTVEGLIAAQYEQGIEIMEAAKANAGNDKMAQDISSLMERMMPKLERIENINCDRLEGEHTYMCSADITQTIAGNSRTNKTNFKFYQVKGEWVLGD